MIIKYGIKDFSRHIIFNIFIIVLIALTFLACIFASSSIYQQLKYYNIFSDILGGKGYYAQISRNDDSGRRRFFITNELEDLKTFSSMSEYFNEVYAAYQVLDSAEHRLTDNAASYAYRDNMIYNYEPMISEGKWLADVKPQEGVIHAVISPNKLGIKTGDVITQSFTTADGTVTAEVEIVGVFRDGAKFYGIYPKNGEPQEDDFYKNLRIDELFHNYYQSVYNAPVLIYNYAELEKIGSISTIYSGLLMSYKPDLTDEQFNEAYLDMVDFTSNIVPFEDIRSATLAEVRKQLIILVPVVIGLLILTMISVLSLTAISTHKQLKNYGVLYLCGGRWRQCALINTVTILIDVALSAMLAYIAMTFLSISGKLQTTIVRFSMTELLICVGVAVFVLLVSLLMPFIIIGKTQPKEILKAEE